MIHVAVMAAYSLDPPLRSLHACLRNLVGEAGASLAEFYENHI